MTHGRAVDVQQVATAEHQEGRTSECPRERTASPAALPAALAAGKGSEDLIIDVATAHSPKPSPGHDLLCSLSVVCQCLHTRAERLTTTARAARVSASVVHHLDTPDIIDARNSMQIAHRPAMCVWLN